MKTWLRFNSGYQASSLQNTKKSPFPISFKRICCILFFILIYYHSSLLYAKPADSGLDDKTVAGSDENKKKFQKWAFLPIIAGGAETGLMFGALAVRFLKPESQRHRTATIDFITFGSTKGQYMAIVNPNLYFSKQKYHLNAVISGAFWPGYFYGIGNNTPEEDPLEYESTSFQTGCLFERRIGKSVYLGSTYTFRHETVDITDAPAPEDTDIPGMDGGNQSGPGATLSFDTRDNINDARTGTHINFEYKWFRDTFGSDYDYDFSALKAGQYLKVTHRTGLAFGCQVRRTRGDIPFRELSSPDGTTVLRGIENGRYRDRDMAALQTEYRFPIHGKWSGTVFAETAQVAHDLRDLNTDGWKYSLGMGIRYALNPSERFNFRLDLSWVDDGLGFALNVREAF